MVVLRVARHGLALGIVGAVAATTQVPLALHSTVKATGTRTAFTPQFSASVERYLAENGVPALSAGVVYVNGNTVETEFATWGNRTEDGDPMTKEVHGLTLGSKHNAHRAVDPSLHRLMLEGVPVRFYWHSHGRLCEGQECHRASFRRG